MKITGTQKGLGAAGQMWSIDILRMYAVMGVVTYHSFDAAARVSVLHTTNPAPFARLGLDIFFVLSGFLVWSITRKRAAPPALFWVHRLTRLAPMYWLATLAFVAFFAVVRNDLVYKPVPPTWPHLLLSLGFVPHWNPARDIAPVLAPGWTLTYDVYYFALFGIVLAFPKAHQLLAATIIFTGVVAGHALRIDAPLAQVYTHPRALDFLAGIWIAEAYERGWMLPRRAGQALSLAGGFLYLALIVFQLGYKDWVAIPWMAASVMSTYGLVSVEHSGKPWLPVPFAQHIGAWSYCIYLVQPIAITLVCLVMPGGQIVKFASAIGVSVALGGLAHVWIEAPLNRALKRLELGSGLRAGGAVTVAP